MREILYHDRYRSVCHNGLEVPMLVTDEAVLTTIETNILHPSVIDATIGKALDALRPSAEAHDTRRDTLAKALANLDDGVGPAARRSPRAVTSVPCSRPSRAARPNATSSERTSRRSVRRPR